MTATRFSVFVLLLGISRVTAIMAHDFWLQPQAFWLSPNEETSLILQVGHGSDRQRSPIAARRITRFVAFTESGTAIDLRSRLHPGAPADDGTLSFQEPGTYVLVLETDNGAQSHMSAFRFNNHIMAEGLTPALEHRTRALQMGAAASEMYSRRAKAIMQVGASSSASQSRITEPLGLALEIIPERNPYADPRPRQLPVRVMYEGQPLAGALIKLNDLANDEAPVETHRTDGSGRAVFAMPPAGNWRLNVVWTKPLPATNGVDYETIFSSLSFGLPR